MDPNDFWQASEEDRDLLCIRFSPEVRASTHAFAALCARIRGEAGPKLVEARPAEAGNGYDDAA